MATGIGINRMADPNNEGQYLGRTPLDDRLINAGLRTDGVLKWAGITPSTTGLSYTIADGFIVQVPMGSGNGSVLGAPAGQTITTYDDGTSLVGTSGTPRIDTIYVRQFDAEQGDDNVDLTFLVAKGTPATNPVAPTLPARSLAIQQMLYPANATVASAATVNNARKYSIPYGGTLGVLFNHVDTGIGDSTSSWVTSGSGKITVPTDRLIRLEMILTGIWVNPVTANGIVQGTVNGQILIDGASVLFQEWNLSPQAQSHYCALPIKITAGTHTVAFQIKDGVSRFKRYYGSGTWPGQVVTISDEGVVA